MLRFPRRCSAYVLVAGVLAAQTTLIEIAGTSVGQRFGVGACALGDVDGDFVPDFAVMESPQYPTPPQPPGPIAVATISFRSGFDGRALSSFGLPGISHGPLQRVGDVDGDGVPDFAVGHIVGYFQSGPLTVRSGADGSTIWTYANGFDYVHTPVDAGYDYDGDGTADVLVKTTAPWTNLRQTLVLSGATGLQLAIVTHGNVATTRVERFVGDVDGVLGSEFAVGGAGTTGVVQIRGGPNAAVLRTHAGAANDRLGVHVSGLGDVDGDGVPDYAAAAVPVAAAFPPAPAAPPYVRVFSGATGATIYTVSSTVAPGAGGAMTRFGDVDGDGVGDFSALRLDAAAGMLHRTAFSGATGAVLSTVSSPTTSTFEEEFEVSAADFNFDGVADSLRIAPNADDAANDAGSVRMVSQAAVATASAVDLGGGLGAVVAPTFSLGSPTLGGSTVWTLSGGAPSVVGNVALDFAPDVPTPLGFGATFHLDLAHAAQWWLVPVGTAATGSFSFGVDVPAIPLLAGVPLTAQVVLFGTPSPLGVDLSNGVRAVLGY